MTYRQLLPRIHQLEHEIRPPDHTEISHLVQRQKQHEKWRLMHEYVRLKPFRVRTSQARSKQWHDAMNQVRELRDTHVIDFLWQQAQIARNFERGIQDMRPRRRGTCHEALLEFLAMRESKALRVLKWEEESQREGCFRINGDFHARSREILERHWREREEEEGISLDDPWLRS